MDLERLIADIRAALGLAEDADPVAAIAALNARIREQDAVIAGDRNAVDQAELSRLRRELSDAQRRYLVAEGETQQRVQAIEAQLRQTSAEQAVDALISSGRIRPVARDVALSLYMGTPSEQWPDVVALLPSVDLAERGVATGSALSELEPTQATIAVLRAVGEWDDKNPTASKIAYMKVEAQKRGMTLPEGYTGTAS